MSNIDRHAWLDSEERTRLILDYKNELIKVLPNDFDKQFAIIVGLLDRLDFWDCPASTKYHGSEYGGLLRHSLKVLYIAKYLLKIDKSQFPWEIEPNYLYKAILLHDICKCHCYQPNILKNGSFSKTGNFFFKSDRGMGYHGDKSLALLLEAGVELNDEEMNYIRWHMGAYTVEGMFTWNKIKTQFPKVELISICDQLASMMEGVGGNEEKES